VRRKLIDADDYLAVAPGVVRVRLDVPIPDIDTALPAAPADSGAVVALAERYGLESPFNRVLNAFDIG